MNKPTISIIVAMDLKRGIGKNNGLLWHIPEELKHFREITTGHPIIMGRKTYESIGKPLPNRTNIVITRDTKFKAVGVVIVNSLDDALNTTKFHPGGGTDEEIFIIGGGQIYKQAIESGLVDKLYITIVHQEFPEATVFFPEYEHLFTKIISEKYIKAEGTKDGKPEIFRIKFLELVKTNS